jgi:hypothetical protein
MQLTTLGWMFIPLVVLVAVAFRAWLPALLLFSMALQAGSVLNLPVGGALYGVSPYWFAAAAAAPYVLAGLLSRRTPCFSSPAQRGTVMLLAAYGLVAIAGAFVLPWLFAGTPVFALLGPIGFGGDTTPLAFGLSHLAQAVNLVVHGVVLVYLLQQQGRPDWRAYRLFVGLAAAVLLVLGIGIYERLAMSLITTTKAGFWMNNPGYAQGQWASVAGIYRISAPFSEPSYGSTYLAAVALGWTAVAAFGRRVLLAVLAAFVVGLGLLNSLGSTGIAAAVLGVVVILAALSTLAARAPASAQHRRRARGAWLGVLLGAGVLVWLVAGSPWSEEVARLVEGGVVDKLGGDNSLSTTARRHSNEHALALLIDTYGLGTGLGSNRASSYFASLLSNVGLAGFVLFCAALGLMLRDYFRAAALSDGQLFALATCLGATAGVAIGIPDLNLPFYWGFVYLAVLWMPRQAGVAPPAAGRTAPRSTIATGPDTPA